MEQISSVSIPDEDKHSSPPLEPVELEPDSSVFPELEPEFVGLSCVPFDGVPMPEPPPSKFPSSVCARFSRQHQSELDRNVDRAHHS